MTTNRCYTHNKPNCKSQYCDVASGKCIKKTKAGRPYKTKLETDLGSSYYYDEKWETIDNCFLNQSLFDGHRNNRVQCIRL